MKTEVTVTQITHGRKYEGTIKGLNGGIIEYKLSFGVPIDELDNQKMPDDKKEASTFAKKLFNFTVIKEGKSLEISDELFSFLISTAGMLAISFYNNSQTEDINEGDGLLSEAIRNKDDSLLGMFGASVSIGSSRSYEIPDEHVPSVLK